MKKAAEQQDMLAKGYKGKQLLQMDKYNNIFCGYLKN